MAAMDPSASSAAAAASEDPVSHAMEAIIQSRENVLPGIQSRENVLPVTTWKRPGPETHTSEFAMEPMLGCHLYSHHIVTKSVSPGRLNFYVKEFQKMSAAQQSSKVVALFWNRPSLLFQIRQRLTEDYQKQKSLKRRAAALMDRQANAKQRNSGASSSSAAAAAVPPEAEDPMIGLFPLADVLAFMSAEESSSEECDENAEPEPAHVPVPPAAETAFEDIHGP
jgi:hypothetical protein